MFELNEFFDDLLFTRSNNLAAQTNGFFRVKSAMPEHVMRRNDGKLVFDIDLPGVTQENLDINIEDNRIVVSAVRNSKKNTFSIKPDTLYPETRYDLVKTEARLAHGVLSLVIPEIQKQADKKKINLIVT